MADEESSGRVPISWVILYVLLTLGVTLAAVSFVGGAIL
jgi:hypothetical protein